MSVSGLQIYMPTYPLPVGGGGARGWWIRTLVRKLRPGVWSLPMSRSTISTTTHLISKYSRAYSINPTRSQNSDGEWQHFSNPVLKVVLDVKRCEAGDRLESFRL